MTMINILFDLVLPHLSLGNTVSMNHRPGALLTTAACDRLKEQQKQQSSGSLEPFFFTFFSGRDL